MTAEEWVRTINQIIAKTRDGRLKWQHDEAGRGSRADVDGRFRIVLQYELLNVRQDIRARPDSLRLALVSNDGDPLAVLSEAECRKTEGQADDLALQSLFRAVVVEPRQRQLSDFRSALDQL